MNGSRIRARVDVFFVVPRGHVQTSPRGHVPLFVEQWKYKTSARREMVLGV